MGWLETVHNDGAAVQASYNTYDRPSVQRRGSLFFPSVSTTVRSVWDCEDAAKALSSLRSDRPCPTVRSDRRSLAQARLLLLSPPPDDS